jgi:hypothetical protein
MRKGALHWSRYLYLGIRFPPSPPAIPWRELPPWLRALRTAVLLAGFGFLISLWTSEVIENAALRQPYKPWGMYVHPLQPKGARIHYINDQLQRLYQEAHLAMMVSLVAALILGGISSSLEGRLRERRRRARLEQFARGFDEQEEP